MKFTLLFVFCFLLPCCHGNVWEKSGDHYILQGNVSEQSNWFQFAEYCAVNRTSVSFQFSYPKTFSPETIYLYIANDTTWKDIRAYQTCEEKVSVLDPSTNSDILLSTTSPWSSCAEKTDQIECTPVRTFSSSRPRCWKIVVANCNSTQGLRLNYKLNFTDDGYPVFPTKAPASFGIRPESPQIFIFFAYVIGALLGAFGALLGV